MFCLSVALTVLLSPAIAGSGVPQASELSPEHQAAEHHRLSGEIRSLARRSAWKGVDQTYDRISLLEVEMSWEDHLYGAHASSELGKVADTHARLLAAVHLQPEKVLVDWLWAIDHSYGRVHLSAEGSSLFEADAIPFDPVERKAVERAIEACEKSGGFEGMLPVGHYTFNGQTLVVEAGQQHEIIAEEPESRIRLRRVR